MANPDSRNKVVSIRLSETEYALLKERRRAYGARNVSDLARLALDRLLAGPAVNHSAVAAKLADLDGRVHALESQLRAGDALFEISSSIVENEPL